uniref:Threonine-phosphate decarboxylase n=1 Tax=Pseudomonas marincola TaxID=437900 RepID=A0A653DXQ8_9PSED
MLEHGGRLREAAQKYNIALSLWLDLSTGIAPYTPELAPVSTDAWRRLPELDDGLEAAACAFYSAPQLLPVAGSQAAIQALPRLRKNQQVAIVSPAYAEHAAAWLREGHQVNEIEASAIDAYVGQVDVLVLINPGNPTGTFYSPQQLLGWHRQLAGRGGWLVVDEAFIDCTPELSLAPQTAKPGLIVLRSLGKFFGLAGARLALCWPSPKCWRRSMRYSDPGPSAGPRDKLPAAC